MLALHYICNRKTVTIVVPSPLLKKQMLKYTDQYIAKTEVKVLTINEVKHEAVEPDVFICDEFDYMLENQAVTFAKNSANELTLFGLAPVFHCSKTYLISATCDPYHTKLLNQVFGVHPNTILDMPSV